ncbi:helix-turn-helix transcriptional regulator [Mycobacterium sp. 21AC1]|uniref:helix-turn-helix transcriptional regulator n=1 Tax=[Mycobacterium] appelbergii TaxID=2939269 RepID=UPI002938FD42|nr:helix-turn-helix transcriptional regulator [Mycobacterium sp. 21AC1]MDV3125027.1 helix-turn-helix transcriptional regulator [Mycobacterium sp. 21AC1]
MRGAWTSRPGQIVVAGAFGDIEVHHHPAIQVVVGIDGPLELVGDDDTAQRCLVAVVAGGIRHALRSWGANGAFSIYLSPETPTATALHALGMARGATPGLWAVDDVDTLAAATSAAVRAQDLTRAADLVIDDLLCEAPDTSSVHPQLCRAIELVAARMPGRADLGSVAGEVALSPDYLGRLFKKQTGASFAATARWVRLLAGLDQLSQGVSITDAAHLAGFADGAHATRVCRELTGIAPRDVVRALR